MPISPHKINYDQFKQSNASSQGYDLAVEKQRIAEGTEEIKKELLEKWSQRYANAPIFPAAISGMSASLVQFLLSFEHTLFYNELAKKFNLSSEQRAVVPEIIWHVCQTKDWEALGSLLQKNLMLSSDTIEQIAQNINTRILSQTKELSTGTPLTQATGKQQENAAPTIIQLPFSQVLKEFPEIGEQLLTMERIHVLSFPDSVRPSLKNWLADYTSYFGYEKHSPVEIGNYLFHGENTEKLRPAERQKLTYLFTAFNDNTSISINKTTRQIVFPATVMASANSVKPQFANVTPPVSTQADASSSRGKQTSNNNQISNSNPVYSQQKQFTPQQVPKSQIVATRPITNPNFKIPPVPQIARPQAPIAQPMQQLNTAKETIALPLNQAIQEMPKIGAQLLTTDSIYILSTPNPVQPSLNNWLADYMSYTNNETNTPLEPSIYTLHSENAQKLSFADRQKLSYILQAFNNKTTLRIDRATEQIVFPSAGATAATDTPSQVSNSLPKLPVSPPQVSNQAPSANKISFSSPQKLAYEEEAPARGKIAFAAPKAPTNLPTGPYPSATPRQNTIVLQKKTTTPRPSDRNVVDLRQE